MIARDWLGTRMPMSFGFPWRSLAEARDRPEHSKARFRDSLYMHRDTDSASIYLAHRLLAVPPAPIGPGITDRSEFQKKEAAGSNEAYASPFLGLLPASMELAFEQVLELGLKPEVGLPCFGLQGAKQEVGGFEGIRLQVIEALDAVDDIPIELVA